MMKRYVLFFISIFLFSCLEARGPQNTLRVTAAQSNIRSGDLQKHILFLASKELEGRATASRGEQQTVEYIQKHFQRLGLRPYRQQKFLQPFTYMAGSELGTQNQLTSNQIHCLVEPCWRLGKDFNPLSFSQSAHYESELTSDVVFAGYGLQIPNEAGQLEYDSYQNINVQDRMVMIFRYLPENLSLERKQAWTRHSDLLSKARVARKMGAKGILVVSGPNSAVKNELISFDSQSAHEQLSVMALSITDALAQILLGSQYDLQQLQNGLDNGVMQPGFILQGVKIQARTDIQQRKAVGHNVIGYLPAASGAQSGKRAEQKAIMIGAHLDHLGVQEGETYFGADDNASGVAATLEIAERLVYLRAKGRWNNQRPLIFAAWSGEELGTLGSQAFHKQFKANEKIAAYLNLDMVGRLRDHLYVQGLSSSQDWPKFLEQHRSFFPYAIQSNQDPYLPTDSTPFYLHQIPILSLFTGSHEDYHSPSDTEERINYDGLEKIAHWTSELMRALDAREEDPRYQEVKDPGQGGRRGFRVTLGLIPSYQSAGVQGLLIDGVRPGSPAAMAGLQAGDRVLQVASERIENIHDLVYVMAALRPGTAVAIHWERMGQRMQAEIIPQARE